MLPAVYNAFSLVTSRFKTETFLQERLGYEANNALYIHVHVHCMSLALSIVLVWFTGREITSAGFMQCLIIGISILHVHILHTELDAYMCISGLEA